MLRKVISLTLLLLLCRAAFGQEAGLWERYNAEFMSNDGRIMDYYHDLISHSEGQGYGMRLSVLYNDRAAFEKIWLWTKNNLQVRADSLFAWQWGKRSNGEWKVIDYNDAADGDILIASALLEAYEKWDDTGYKNEAIKIIRDIRMNLSIDWHGHTFILPAYDGFHPNESSYELNPSYVILSAYRRFARVEQRSFWEKVYHDGLFLLEKVCFGKWCLPADWVILSGGKISVSAGRSPYFGNEAVRVVLHLASEDQEYPKGMARILDLYKQMGYFPQWIDLEKDGLSLDPAPAGYYAVYALAAKRSGDDALSRKIFKEARNKLMKEKNGYYSFSLFLLATAEDRGLTR
jgi:endo-1,4-beta-D-glucanase Y